MNSKWTVAAAVGVFILAGGMALAGMDRHRPSDGHPAMHQRLAQGMHPQGMHQGKHQGMHGRQGPGPHGGAEHGDALPKGDQSPASLAFHGVNRKMHAAMDIAFTGDADIDFAQGMIPHHEGAVEMAKIVLAFGKDPEIRKLAEAIIKAQEDEIAFMKGWLQKRGR